jgi:hypothetical protein
MNKFLPYRAKSSVFPCPVVPAGGQTDGPRVLLSANQQVSLIVLSMRQTRPWSCFPCSV